MNEEDEKKLTYLIETLDKDIIDWLVRLYHSNQPIQKK